MPTPVIAEKFGRILTAGQIEEDTVKCLKKWYPTYLAEMERQLGLRPNELPRPVEYTNRNSFDSIKGERIPRVVVISPGLADIPMKNNGSVYRAVWRVGIGVATAARTEEVANRHIKAYAAATRALVLQHQSDLTEGTVEAHWIEETYDDLPIPDQHVLYKAASLFFGIDIEYVVNRRSGVTQPDIDAPSDWDTADTVDIDLENVGVGDLP